MRGRLSRREWGRRWVPGGHRKSEAAVHRRTHRNPPEEPRFRGFAIQPQGMSRPLHKAHHRTFIRPYGLEDVCARRGRSAEEVKTKTLVKTKTFFAPRTRIGFKQEILKILF